MICRLVVLLGVCAGLGLVCTEVSAQTLHVTQPANSFEAEVFLETGEGDAFEVLRDRRALTLDVRLGRHHFRCAHPLARRAAERESLAAGRHSISIIDVREYCHGRAYRAVAEGASLVLEYGSRRLPAIRQTGQRRPIATTVRSEPLVWSVPHEVVPQAPLTVSIEPQRSHVPRFAVRVEGEARFTYMSPDDWSFVVRGPRGAVLCRRPPIQHGPIARELFRAPRRGRPIRGLVLQPSYACPADVFSGSGIYEVLASARSTADARSVGLRGFVGTLYGPFSWVEVVDRRARRLEFAPRYAYDVATVWSTTPARAQ